MPPTPKTRSDTANDGEPGSWEEDQLERSYYYDDSHDYEVYVPEDECEEDEDEAEKAG